MEQYRNIRHLTSYSTFSGKSIIDPSPTYYYDTKISKLNIIDNNIKTKYDQLYEQNKNNDEIKPNKTVYSTQLALLPAYKLKSHNDDNKLNITKVRKLDKADYVLVNHALIQDLFFKNFSTYYLVPGKFLSPYQKTSNHNSNNLIEVNSTYIVKDDIIEHVKDIDITFYNKIKEFPSFTGNFMSNDRGNNKAASTYDFFIKLINESNKYSYKIIFDENLNNSINQSIVIGDELFESICNMLKSTDSDNWEMAKEIVANSEFESSKPYILFLLWKFDNFRKTNNNKNFEFVIKSLKSYKHIYIEYALEKFLIKVFKINPEYKQILFDCLKIHINSMVDKDIINGIVVS